VLQWICLAAAAVFGPAGQDSRGSNEYGAPRFFSEKDSSMSDYGGIIGLIILALDIWAIINVIQSGASTGSKILWVLLILVLPLLGLIIWYFAGPRGGRATT
jgi:Phospholipase_D-nuclease N-terminal